MYVLKWSPSRSIDELIVLACDSSEYERGALEVDSFSHRALSLECVVLVVVLSSRLFWTSIYTFRYVWAPESYMRKTTNTNFFLLLSTTDLSF